MKTEATSVSTYISKAPAWARSTLKELRATIKSAAPEAKESLSYHMPYYSQNGRLAYFGAYREHCSFFWISTEDMKTYAKELAKVKIVGHSLHVRKGEKVPKAVIKKIIRARVKSNELKKKNGKSRN